MKDTRIREDVFPVRVVEHSGKIEGVEKFLACTDLQIGVSEKSLIHISGKAHVILDFGKEYNAGVRILTHSSAQGTTRVRIRCGESVSECSGEIGERGGNNHHSLRDSYADLVNWSDLCFFETGFRFVRLDFPEDTDTYLKTVTAVYIHRDLPYAGGFTCNDARVNEIFEVAARTLTLNMQRYIWDGIKRDRLVWVGDMHPETLGILCLFGADASVLESLEYCRAHTPLPAWMNSIPTYSMWWLVILADYYRQNGDAQYLLSQRAYIDGVMRQIASLVRDDGTVAVNKDCLFDWPSHGKPDERIGITALTYLSAVRGKELFSLLGLDERVCDGVIEKLRGYSRSAAECKQCEAMKVYAGMTDAASAVNFLTQGGARGMSTFMSYYILSAIAQAGQPEKALSIMKEFYGAMLDKGATSFWENFDMDWMEGTSRIDQPVKPGEKDIHGDFGEFCYVGFRHSLCHGWSCGPVPFLMRTLGGIRPLTPGCTLTEVNPVSAGLTEYEIKYPTPLGLVSVRLQNGEYTVTHPRAMQIKLPAGRTDVTVRTK